MAKLEAEGEVNKANNYQDMLNAIAKVRIISLTFSQRNVRKLIRRLVIQDMLTKSRRRSRRRKELISLRNTLKNLEEKAAYLEEQKKSYHDYISACMAQLGNKKQ